MTDNELMPPEVAVWWCAMVGEVLLGGLFVVGGGQPAVRCAMTDD